MKFESFNRQLYLHGFKKIGKRSTDSGAYYHENFIRGELDSCRRIIRWNENVDDFDSRTYNINGIPTRLQNLSKCASLNKHGINQTKTQKSVKVS